MPHAIEHPISIGEGNKHLFDTLSDAYELALELGSNGVKVQRIISSLSHPIIWVKPAGYCLAMKNFVKKKGKDAKGNYAIHAARINGCEINWEIRRAA